jgi:endonuclease/exonuclease/phosphatase (EEP) superfamily protein YafD
MNMEPTDVRSVRRFEAAGLVDAATATGAPCRTTSAEPTSPCDRPDWVWVSDEVEMVRFSIGPPSASDHLPIEVTVSL